MSSKSGSALFAGSSTPAGQLSLSLHSRLITTNILGVWNFRTVAILTKGEIKCVFDHI